jgi:hypothetical protein|tara:strand:- start:370 stop:1011 length:642 start_codon:yes stop_codon:yes gene_type:complete
MRKNHNKLYYGKFRHKTEFKMPGSLMFYPTTDEHLIRLKKEYPDAPDMNRLADFIIQNRRKMKFRFQDRKAIFYTDLKTSLSLIDNFWEFWTKSEAVDPKFKDLDKNVIGCTRLPHGKYQYQVYLKKDAQLVLNDNQRNRLWEFLERNVDDCLVTNYSIIDYFEKKSPYCFGGYFYVKEQKFLSPIYMIAQQAIEKVIKFRKVKNGSNKKTTR